MNKKYIMLICSLVLIIGLLAILLYLKWPNNKITLKTNGGVPYTWQYTIKDDSIVKFKKKETKVKDKNLAGGEVIEYYFFEGLKKGKTTIKFEYKSIVDSKVDKTKTYKVTVSKNKKVQIKEEK